ncbi:FtsX-like permease family protein [Nonomuraea basaltis]|uniref:FtsX-like permease family protein n=1 Tax=Nonomuraea basaltis TaxID=2495887 RepID=UPI00110C5B93|nr:FtsX-like permease family protein [Nonomuraea basaltis]TMR99629.1 FtsX-like permease family protein [Nonomuraea basaltis]
MVLLPGFAGCLIGTVLGGLAAQPLLHLVLQGLGSAIGLGVSVWVYVATLLGVPAVAVLAALVPASRAHRLSAAQTISAGSASRSGRGQRAQRLLAGARLPRAVGLGLGLPPVDRRGHVRGGGPHRAGIHARRVAGRGGWPRSCRPGWRSRCSARSSRPARRPG